GGAGRQVEGPRLRPGGGRFAPRARQPGGDRGPACRAGVPRPGAGPPQLPRRRQGHPLFTLPRARPGGGAGKALGAAPWAVSAATGRLSPTLRALPALTARREERVNPAGIVVTGDLRPVKKSQYDARVDEPHAVPAPLVLGADRVPR